VRTPLPALASAAPFKGVRTSLVAEPFATTADIYRLLGTLPDGADQQESADGRGKSTPETETRLARIVGRDRDEAAPEAWRRLAAFFAEAQLRQLQDAAALILSRAELSGDAPVIGCGVGAFIARRLADRLERPYREWASLVGSGGDPAWISACAPAVAVALID
jgi:(4-(4-[2-(gamma-L-glutamylamino)ethyl]phenoxymethyl)furan-2-yl)methanamine synthase